MVTATELKTRYPEFTVVSDARVSLFIDDAAADISTNWLERDRDRATMALACHMMSVEGEPNASDTNVDSDGARNGRFLQSIKVGDTSNTFAETAAAAAVGNSSKTSTEASFMTTPYGQTYFKLRKKNFSGPRSV